MREVRLPSLFAVADDSDTGCFLVVDRQPHRIVLGVAQRVSGQRPVGASVVMVEALAVDRLLMVEPRRLGHAADHGGDERFRHLLHDPAEEVQGVAADNLLDVFVRVSPPDQAADDVLAVGRRFQTV